MRASDRACKSSHHARGRERDRVRSHLVPFYRYLRVWTRNEQHYVDNDAAMTSLFGRPNTPAEYRRLCELADHGRAAGA